MGTVFLPGLAFAGDPSGLSRNERVIKALGARPLPLDELTGDRIADCPILVVDADLTVSENVRRLRAELRTRRTDYLNIFAVDLGRRLETVHAQIVGATALMRRPFDLRELRVRIAAFQESEDHHADDRADASIAAAAEALGEMFGALTHGQAIDLPSLAEASAEVVDAIQGLGFPSWVNKVRQHHEGTFQHCIIVTGLASAFGQATGMSYRDRMVLTTAGLLHDIGKAAVPVALLDKPGRLTPEEFEIVKSHPGLGYDYLCRQEGVDAAILPVVRGHHEYLDGSGYPDGLSGSRIGDLTRILTICDVYGALIERRSYKAPTPPAAAFSILDEMAAAGKLEGPLVRAFQHAVA